MLQNYSKVGKPDVVRKYLSLNSRKYDPSYSKYVVFVQRIAGGNKNPWDYRSWAEQHSYHGKWLQYPEIRTSGPVCGLDPA